MDTDKNIFQILTPGVPGGLEVQLDALSRRLDEWMDGRGLTESTLVQARVYLSDAANQWEAVRRHRLCAAQLAGAALSYVEQAPLDGSKVAVQLWLNTSPSLRRGGTPEVRWAEMDGKRWLFHTVRFGTEAAGLTACAQTVEAFRRHGELLAENGMTLERNCQRTWIYVRDVDRHYAGVVEGRNRVFDEAGLTAATHFIASTGIGGATGCREALVAVDFLSVEGLADGDVKYLQALDYLNPTYEYGVAFERATALTLPGCRLALVSGTASIDKHGECLYRGDVVRQADRLFLNIAKLLEDAQMQLADLKYAVVYLRDVADAAVVRDYLRSNFPQLPALVVEARVCRPEWLIEVEGIASVER